MRKQSTLLTLLLLIALPILHGCGNGGAKKTAEKAVEYQINGDLSAYYDLLSKEDQKAITLDKFIEMYRLPEAQSQLLEIIPEARKEYKVSKFKETLTDDRALVTYVLEMPNLDEIGRGTLSLNDLIVVMKDKKVTSLANLPEQTVTKLQEEAVKSGIPTIEVTNQINLVREDEDWKVYLNLKETLLKKSIPTPFNR